MHIYKKGGLQHRNAPYPAGMFTKDGGAVYMHENTASICWQMYKQERGIWDFLFCQSLEKLIISVLSFKINSD